jgi:hypothetical protein
MIDAIVLATALMVNKPVVEYKVSDSSYKESEYYMPKKEKIRKCIVWRESRGDYTANGTGGAGAYQFIQSTWTHYAKAAGFTYWSKHRAHHAPKYVQDAVFWRTWNHGKGKFHWSTRWNPGITSCFKED